MPQLVELYRQAERLDIPVYHLPLTQLQSLSYMDPDGRCYIGLDLPRRHSEAELREHLAHELGHCCTGSFYNRYSPCDLRRAHENRADKDAVLRLIPVDELDQAIADGITEQWELAEHFGVGVPFLQKALCWYTYGNLATELYF